MRASTIIIVAACCIGAAFSIHLPAAAQQPPAAARPTVALDPASIRRQAAQLAEVRGLLADPDANVRLLAIREIARGNDPIQRQLAIDAGLSSAEAAMQEVALRAVLADTRQIVIQLAKPDGSPVTDDQTSVALSVVKFDPNDGRIGGRYIDTEWDGQVQGAVFAFAAPNRNLSGSLVWDSEAGEFRGKVNTNGGRANSLRNGSWRPR